MKNQMETLELKNIITLIKNQMNKLNNRMEGVEERIRQPEDRTIEITQSEQQSKQTDKK